MLPFESGALMITRRTLDGAWKCSLRLFLRLECRLVLIFVILAVVDEAGPGAGSVLSSLSLASSRLSTGTFPRSNSRVGCCGGAAAETLGRLGSPAAAREPPRCASVRRPTLCFRAPALKGASHHLTCLRSTRQHTWTLVTMVIMSRGD